MIAPKLELIGISRTYDNGAVVAVDGIDLVVQAGETLALLGPSGCGKSTTLNMIVGLETPSAGDIRIDGVSVVATPPGSRNVGLVFQDYAVFTHMTVARNLEFGLAVRGMAKPEITRRVAEVAELLDLTALLREPAARLGGSQLQRVAIGRTLVTRPALLLLDEPLSNLETEARLAMRRELRRLQAETGLTIIYVTHDQIEALSLASRIAVMSHGRIRQCDSADIVHDRPAHIFVAGFIGSPPMNLIRGELDRDADGPRFRRGRLAIALPDALVPRTLADRASLILGLRPEALTLRPVGTGGAIAGTVSLVEPRGAETIVTLDAAGVTIQALVASSTRPIEGEALDIGFHPASLVLFSGDSGHALDPGMLH